MMDYTVDHLLVFPNTVKWNEVDGEIILQGQEKVPYRRDIEPEHQLDGSSGEERVLGRGYSFCKDLDVGRSMECQGNQKRPLNQRTEPEGEIVPEELSEVTGS